MITPDWPAPPQIRAFCTTRVGGVSQPPFDTLNLGDHVGDVPASVKENRNRLQRLGHMPAAPLWLNQVHSTMVVDSKLWHTGIEADAIYSNQPDQVCLVMTADCLPLLLCDDAGQQVAAVHAGWRGLAAGIIENSIRHFSARPERIMAWLGPAIGPEQFEVGQDVYDAFTSHAAKAATAFRPTDEKHYLADIYQLARQRLRSSGVEQIYGGQYCTFSDPQRFFSYRRDGQTGRMGSAIWIASE